MDGKSTWNSLPERGWEGENGRRNGKLPRFLLEAFHLEYCYSRRLTSRCGTQSFLVFPQFHPRECTSHLPASLRANSMHPRGRGSSGSLGTGCKSSGMKTGPSNPTWKTPPVWLVLYFHWEIPLGWRPRKSTWISSELIPVIQTTRFSLGNAQAWWNTKPFPGITSTFPGELPRWRTWINPLLNPGWIHSHKIQRRRFGPSGISFPAQFPALPSQHSTGCETGNIPGFVTGRGGAGMCAAGSS